MENKTNKALLKMNCPLALSSSIALRVNALNPFVLHYWISSTTYFWNLTRPLFSHVKTTWTYSYRASPANIERVKVFFSNKKTHKVLWMNKVTFLLIFNPVMSYWVYVNFVEAKAEIEGPSLKYLTPGSTLKLICKVLQSTEASSYIFWYHDQRMINYDLDRGINVSSEAGNLN